MGFTGFITNITSVAQPPFRACGFASHPFGMVCLSRLFLHKLIKELAFVGVKMFQTLWASGNTLPDH